MKRVVFGFFAILLQLSSFVVHSQYVDPCDNVIDFNNMLNFDTTAMSCQIVWDKQGYTLRYAKAGTELWSFLLSVYDQSSWFAMGFSTDGQMKGSSAMVGWVLRDGTGNVLQYNLTDTNPDGVIPNQGDLVVVKNSTAVFKQSSRLYMAFQLRTLEPRTELLYALGAYVFPSASNGLKLSVHRDVFNTKINYQTGLSQAQKSPYTGLRKTHGAMNMIGWGILMPIGAIVARYFRQWEPMWFYTHTSIQIFGFMVGIAGFMLGFVVDGFIKAEVTYHKNIGVTILILSCLQVVALLIRPQKKMKVRKYWNWYHHNAGRIVVILAISNIFYGTKLGMEGPSWYVTYAVIIGILFVTAIVLEIRLRTKA